MACCSHCVDAGDLFTSRTAQRELKRYRRKGPGHARISGGGLPGPVRGGPLA